jgi:hypothetical protein
VAAYFVPARAVETMHVALDGRVGRVRLRRALHPTAKAIVGDYLRLMAEDVRVPSEFRSICRLRADLFDPLGP